jgi:simple sugar transport system permease protein
MKPRKSSPLSFLGKIEGLPIAIVLLVLYIVFIITAPLVFQGYRIYMSFLQTVPPLLVCGLGLTFVITAGEIDLSFSAVMAFSGFIFAWGYKTFPAPWGPWFSVLLALASGGLVGYINGLLVAKLRVPSIMATLAAQFFWSGLSVLLAGGKSWSIEGITTNIVHTVFVGRLFGIVPAQAFWALGLAIVLWFILNRHKFGEEVMFVGDNEDVARVMGINVEATKIKLFTMMGVIAAFGALLLTIEMNTYFDTQGAGFLLPTMAAVFIGGTSIAGGAGSIVGSFFGAYIIGSLDAGVVATGIGGYWTQLVSGLVMTASVVLNILISEGSIARFAARLPRWATFGRSSPDVETPKIMKKGGR